MEISRPALAACIAILAAGAWMSAKVRFQYQGAVSGLFHTDAHTILPPELDAHTARVRKEPGYDGQYYHLAVHDPFLRHGYASMADNPRLRWRRIGVPLAAWVLSAGSARLVDHAYALVLLAFTGLGAFWLARLARQSGCRPEWGLAFLLVPAAAVSIDRMTVDLPLAAIVTAVLAGAGPVTLLLAAGCLIRETGLVVAAAWCLWRASQRDWTGVRSGALAAIPAILWWTYVHARTPPDGTVWLSRYPFAGLVDRTLPGGVAPVGGVWMRWAERTEHLALAGIWLALILAAILAWRRRLDLPGWIAVMFAVFAAALGKTDIWESAYAARRTMSPLLIALAVRPLSGSSWIWAAPLLLVVPRIALQYEAQIRSMWQ